MNIKNKEDLNRTFLVRRTIERKCYHLPVPSSKISSLLRGETNSMLILSEEIKKGKGDVRSKILYLQQPLIGDGIHFYEEKEGSSIEYFQSGLVKKSWPIVLALMDGHHWNKGDMSLSGTWDSNADIWEEGKSYPDFISRKLGYKSVDDMCDSLLLEYQVEIENLAYNKPIESRMYPFFILEWCLVKSIDNCGCFNCDKTNVASVK